MPWRAGADGLRLARGDGRRIVGGATLDPATGRTLARYRQDGVFYGFADGSSYVVGYEETDAGVPFLHLLNPRLFRR